MSKDSVSFFSVGNGDCVLLEAGGKTVLTDIHYREKCKDDDESDYYDYRPDLKAACKRGAEYKLDVFVSTHLDKDHVLGFGEIFHTGKPSSYDSTSGKILANEIWCNPYSVDPHYVTEMAKPLSDEISRRKALIGTASADEDGNRIKILSANNSITSGEIGSSLTWKLLAPTQEEANIPKSEDKDRPNSCNDSSLVILWSYKNGDRKESVLLAGDAGVDVFERINKDFSKSELTWSVLLAPHHCSRSSLARKNDKDEYDYSESAIEALSNVKGDGFIVASCKEIKRNNDNPPSWSAKQKFLAILKEKRDTDHEKRFSDTATYKGGKPGKIVFELSESGIKKKSSEESRAFSAVGKAASSPHVYGCE